MGWPLRRYLVGLVVVFVAAAAAGVVYGWITADRDARTAALQDASFGARLAATDIGGDVTSIRDSVAALAGNPDIASAFAAPTGCSLQLQLPGGPDAGHLDLIRPDGTVVCSSRPAAAGTTGLGNYAGAAWWPAALRAPGLTAPAADPRTGQPAVLFSTPVPGAGVVAGFVNLHVLGTVLGELYAGPHHLMFLVTTADGGTVLTRSADPGRWVGAALRGTPFGTGDGVGERRDVTGEVRLYQQARVDPGGLRVYAGVDRALALADAHRLALRQTLIISTGLLVALLAALVIHRRITRPIQRLSTAVRAAADDPPGARPAGIQLPTGGPAEVAALADQFTALILAVNQELGERHRAEQAALQAQRSYRQLFDDNPYPMCVLDLDTLAILEVNDAAVAHYGYPRPEFLSLTLPALRLPEDMPTLQQAIDTEHAATERSGPVRHVRKDGSVIDVVITSHALTFNGRQARCAVIEDVTEKENIERRQRQSQRLESLGQLAGGVAHDFNNLLGIIAGYTSFAVDDLSTAARSDPRWQPLSEDLAQVLKATDRAAGLTRQLLSFARREVTRPQLVNVNTVVAEVEQMLRRTIGDDINLHTHLAQDLPPVTADPGQLEQVLLNLAVNARDAMPTGGTLAIETDTITVDGHDATERPGPHVRLRVSDTGTGMSRDTIDRAFEPFFTTKPQGQGTGLGLATIYGIVTGAGGHVHLHSTLGAGTTVTVLLPATDAANPSGTQPASRQTRAGRGETILVVEDEDSLRTLTERVLTRYGYKVLTAANGPDALGAVANHHGHLDLLLTDVVMPHMPGHELADHLRHSHPDLPVIYMSGYAEPILTTQKTLPPEVTLLNKPVPEHLLLATIRDTLDHHAEHCE
jgi:PAS domain S-box-containing protein